MSKLSLVGGDAGIGEVLLHAPETDETRIYDFPDETGTFALREFDTRSKGIGSNRNEYDLLEELILKIFDA